MQKTSKLLWSCIAGMTAIVCVSGAYAASRSVVATSNSGRTRMPTMPTMSINTIGTHAVSGVTTTGGNGSAIPDVPNGGGNGGNGGGNGGNGGGNGGNGGGNGGHGGGDNNGDCPDGGVRNSSFTVDDCMQSVLNCVQSGVLPHGLNDLFNEDLRNSIINGMGICASEIDKCIREVRVDCRSIYDSSVDVWLDFNSRIVQPEYYNFVLRRTGLTPNQAENVCELLDKNTYGRSFAAVATNGGVTSEYNDKVGAYNEQMNGSLSKNQPQGPMVNNTANGNVSGVDGERGHYARWDATNAVCKVRVAAYNKDKLITNNWLFGALGDDRAAEVWQDAGSTFTCNKDLFDFSLLNDTSTVAATALPGGALVGAGIGALAGHDARAFDCNDDDMRKELWQRIKDKKLDNTLSTYLKKSVPLNPADVDTDWCEDLLKLYDKYRNVKSALPNCSATGTRTASSVYECKIRLKDNGVFYSASADCGEFNATDGEITLMQENGDGTKKVALNETRGLVDKDGGSISNTTVRDLIDECKAKCGVTEVPVRGNCRFSTLQNVERVDSVLCNGEVTANCVDKATAETQVAQLDKVYNNIGDILMGQNSNRGKSALVGAGVGLGAGGVATAITAFVERNNISCHVGDGLNTVGFGKAFTIDSLKDFYVKWNLRVADSISPTARVTSCADWIATCGMYTTAEDCKAVQINYQKPGRNTTTLVRSACKMSGSVCIENRSVAVSYGACTRDGRDPTPITPNQPDTPWASTTDVKVIQH